MADRDLQNIASSGELTELMIGGAAAGDAVLTSDEVDALFGNYTITTDSILNGTKVAVVYSSVDNSFSYGASAAILNLIPVAVNLTNLTISNIDSASATSAVTKQWAQAKGIGNATQDVSTATHSLGDLEQILHVSYTATGAVTITLATDQVIDGRTLTIKDAGGNATTYNITIQTEGAETIDGAATLVMSSDYDSVSLYSNGTNWYII